VALRSHSCVAQRRVNYGSNNGLFWLTGDHLGSTSVTANSSGTKTAELRYKAWGETRYTSGTTLTTFKYTGQREESSFGLYYYGARWYDSALGRFTSPDTVIPSTGNPQDWDRYSYVRNNPVNYKDPSGHEACDEDGNCYDSQGWHRAQNAPRLSAVDTWKMMIWGKFGVTMSDAGNKNRSTTSLRSAYASLQNINNAMNNMLKPIIAGTTFRLMKHGGDGSYNGQTTGNSIDFYTIGDVALRQMNIYHEVGHLLNNVTDEAFENAVSNEDNPSWVGDDQKVNPAALKSDTITNDPNWASVQARQAYKDFGASEQWADAFANYVAGNIDMSKADSPGTDMYNFVTGALAPYIGTP
jgi:RHS repeat-associated protein